MSVTYLNLKPPVSVDRINYLVFKGHAAALDAKPRIRPWQGGFLCSASVNGHPYNGFGYTMEIAYDCLMSITKSV